MKSIPYFNIALEETYRDGQIIFEEGNSGDWIYVVLSGAVEISKTINGNRFVLSTLQPGDVFGELALIGAVKRTATSRAVGETRVGIINRELLDKEFNKLSSDFRNVLVLMVERFITMLDRSRDFATRSEERVTKSLSLRFHDGQSFVNAYSVNISSGGLFIETDSPLPVGERFSLELEIPDVAEALEATCEVVWARDKTKAAIGKPTGIMSGAEAIARGAIESGVRIVSGYPGYPITGIVESVNKAAVDDLHVEWAHKLRGADPDR
jgi:uncharacterized protein (TIGR02266 family)